MKKEGRKMNLQGYEVKTLERSSQVKSMMSREKKIMYERCHTAHIRCQVNHLHETD